MFHNDCHMDTMATTRVHPKKFLFKPTPLTGKIPDRQNFFSKYPGMGFPGPWGKNPFSRQIIGAALTTTQNHRAKHLGVCRLQKRYNFFLANNLLIAKFPRPTWHTSNTVDKLNNSKSSGLVNIFMLVLPLVRWWCCCCCLFLRQSMTVSLITVVPVVAVAARRQRQRRRWRRWQTIGGESGR